MLADFIFLLILFGLLYSYTSSQNQFAATASAIRQIWSGNCRLSCRHSEHSVVSGLSGLSPRTSAAYVYATGTYSNHGVVAARSSMPGPSQNCCCESCPCVLIDNFLKQWRPASNVYSQLIACISDFIAFIIHLLQYTYDIFMRIFSSDMSSIQHQQMPIKSRSDSKLLTKNRTDSKLLTKSRSNSKVPGKSRSSSKEKLNLGQETKGSLQRLKDSITKLRKSLSKLSITKLINKKQTDDDKMKVGTSKTKDSEADIIKKGSTSKEKLKDVKADSKLSVKEQKGYCTKCIEKGQVCISECPRAPKGSK